MSRRPPQSRSVVMPAWSECRAFAYAIATSTPSVSSTVVSNGVPSPGRTKWTCASISPGKSVWSGSVTAAASAGTDAGACP